jgi:hypothetical protein
VSPRENLTFCREELLRASLDVLAAERMIAVSASAMTRLKQAEDRQALAARNLTNCISELPPGQRPAHWALDGEADA